MYCGMLTAEKSDDVSKNLLKLHRQRRNICTMYKKLYERIKNY